MFTPNCILLRVFCRNRTVIANWAKFHRDPGELLVKIEIHLQIQQIADNSLESLEKALNFNFSVSEQSAVVHQVGYFF